MLNNADYIDWCLQLGLAEITRATITAARSRNPTRRVGGGRQNVSGRYPSRKMGVTIQFESHRVELPFVQEMEHDPAVLEYYDQPPSIPLAYPTASGRRLSVMHTPDYFVLRHDSAGWVECKTEGDLEKLAIKSPHRYVRDDVGNWRCPPGEAHASALGLDYRVWSSTRVNWKLQRNLQFLDDYLRYDSESTALNVLGDVNFEKANFPAAAEAYRQSLAFGPSQKAIAARYATSLAASVSAQAAAAHYSEWSRSAAPAAPDLDWFVVEEVGLQLLAGEAAPAKTFEQILAKSENADAPLIQARLGWWYYRANNAETAAELIAYGQEIRPA